MAETKTKTKAAKTKAAKPKAKAKGKTQSKVRSQGKAKSKAKPQSKPTQNKASSGAKLPLIAGGAALAGVVGGAALGAKRSGQKMLGVPMPKPKRVQFRTKDLRKAAKEVGGFGENVGDLVSELRRAQEAVSNGKANSPVEILLQGLTKRS